jgi:urease gamma subunit
MRGMCRKCALERQIACMHGCALVSHETRCTESVRAGVVVAEAMCIARVVDVADDVAVAVDAVIAVANDVAVGAVGGDCHCCRSC